MKGADKKHSGHNAKIMADFSCVEIIPQSGHLSMFYGRCRLYAPANRLATKLHYDVIKHAESYGVERAVPSSDVYKFRRQEEGAVKGSVLLPRLVKSFSRAAKIGPIKGKNLRWIVTRFRTFFCPSARFAYNFYLKQQIGIFFLLRQPVADCSQDHSLHDKKRNEFEMSVIIRTNNLKTR